MVGVLVVDDHAVFRSTAQEVIAATRRFELIGEACSGEHALALLEQLDPQLVLLDVRMGGIDGIETARRIAATRPEIVIVLVSAAAAQHLPADAGACGAAAAVRKQDLRPQLLQRLWSQHRPSR